MNIRITCLFLFLHFGLFSQDCCNDDGVAVICYTPELVYCNGVSCPYTLDGAFMDGLSQKLANPANFGPGSISDCELSLVPLVGINNAADVENLACDIVFLGNFATDNNGGGGTFLPLLLLESVKEWSLQCTKNLTILFQGEAEPWGYLVANDNMNPNVAGNVSEPNIFNGPFGSLTQFNQGGTFQGTFVDSPETGNTILARDNNNRPTVVLDNLTNDIIFADVGIMCNGPGDVTVSPEINNDNDILACNVMALGCQIAFSQNNFYMDAELCVGASYVLPNGESVDEPGEYEVVLESANGCDSIITVSLDISDPEDFYFDYSGCVGDDFSFAVGSEVFNEDVTSGIVTIQNQWGCDSTVYVNLEYKENSSSSFDSIICEGSSFMFNDLLISSAVDTQLVLLNAVSCDSVIDVYVETFYFQEIDLVSSVVIENNAAYTFELDVPDDYDILWSPSNDLSCSDCPNPILNNTENIDVYQVSITNPFGCTEVYEVAMTYLCKPYIPNVFSPILGDQNGVFRPVAPCELIDYELLIFDRWGNRVFESINSDESWDGTLNGRDLNIGVYVYQLSYFNGVEASIIAGDITLLR